MTTPLVLRANAELVTAAYVRTIVAAYGTIVGAVLQGPDGAGVVQWGPYGFAQVTVLNDPIDIYVPVRHTVVSLDVWAANTGSSKRPPWGRAYAVAEEIAAAQFDTTTHDTHAVVTLPTGYPTARVTEFSVLRGPARRPGDSSDFAHLGMECTISWHGL